MLVLAVFRLKRKGVVDRGGGSTVEAFEGDEGIFDSSGDEGSCSSVDLSLGGRAGVIAQEPF